MRRPFVSGKLTRSQMAMEGSPYLAEVMRRPAFLWEYSGRFRNAMDNNNLTPEFVEGERQNLRGWREHNTLRRPASAKPQPAEAAVVGGASGANDDIDDATESMKGLGFRDMDVDEEHGLQKAKPVLPGPPAASLMQTQPPRGPTAPGPSTVYVDVPAQTKAAPANPTAHPGGAQPRKPSTGKQKQPEDSEPQPDEKSKRTKMTDAPEQENLVKCSRCACKNLPCIPRKPGKPSPHQKPTMACDACAKVKQACKFAPFTEAREVEVKVKLPKPEKPQSKRAARVHQGPPPRFRQARTRKRKSRSR